MHAELERIVSEDEAARAAVEREVATARARVDAARAQLARERADRLRQLEHQRDDAVAKILVETDHEVARHQSHRETYLRQRTAAAEALFESAVDAYVRLVLQGPPGKADA